MKIILTMCPICHEYIRSFSGIKTGWNIEQHLGRKHTIDDILTYAVNQIKETQRAKRKNDR